MIKKIDITRTMKNYQRDRFIVPMILWVLLEYILCFLPRRFSLFLPHPLPLKVSSQYHFRHSIQDFQALYR
ncbi:hypothetical protein HCUR_00988 [Holospora curviuscula]|uniref:Uncharacterized protein n=1 Tax=Holospora curviuscula TaxID=1082868 RepID=A0A2S5R8A0_9PROT|nr:hypothetical protein HCUR_00988 [Holospora curviuscula]